MLRDSCSRACAWELRIESCGLCVCYSSDRQRNASLMTPSRSYWKNIPRESLAAFLLGVFLIFSTVGIASDIAEMGRMPAVRFALSVFLSGLFPVFYATTGFALRKQFWKAIVPLFIVHWLLMNAIVRWFPGAARPAQMDAGQIGRMESRLGLDALAIMIAVGLGYGCFLYVSLAEGRRYLRVKAEMELAAEIHRVIVPQIEMKLGEFEFYGRSVPSSEVGGDLIGVAPGVVMGMVKSAARMMLSSGDDSRHLMARLNEVLFPLKKPDMFATFCFVA